MSLPIITLASLKNAKARAGICIALAFALSEYDASDTDRTDRGRKAMEKVGNVLLKRLQLNSKVPAPFAGIDGMLSYVNMAKQASMAALVLLAGKGATFDSECEYAYVRKIHSKVVEACNEFQEAWKVRKAA